MQAAWQAFLAAYEAVHRPLHGPLRPDTVAVVEQFHRCGDLAAGFTRLHCPDCGHEKLLAFTCKTRHFRLETAGGRSDNLVPGTFALPTASRLKPPA